MKTFKKALALVLCLTMIFSLVSSFSYAAQWKDKQVKASLSFTTMSDPHFYPYSLTGDNCEAFQEFNASGAKLYYQSEAIVRTALDTMILRNPDLRYIFIPGDLTKDGEYESHIKFAEILREYEDIYGVEFLVINGNHDINHEDSATFENGSKEFVRTIKADEFKEVYADFGYDLAFAEYSGKGDEIQGKLSYAADLTDDNGNSSYRLIAIDSCIYSYGEPSAETGGTITEELMQWIKALADDAKAKGITPMVMVHHGLSAHMEIEPSITFAFPLYGYMDVAERFASWGIHYAFTGHLHTDDISSVINDDGDILYDCETTSVSGFPCTYREMTAQTYTDGETEMSFNSVDFDAAKSFSLDGKTYEKGTFKYEAFRLGYTNGNCTDFLMRMIDGLLDGYLPKIKEAGSIGAFLETMGIDIEKYISEFLAPYIGDGFKIGNIKIFTTENLMWFINDLLDQIYDLYIEDEEALHNLLYGIVDEFLSMQVSEYSCTKFIDTLGFGDSTRPGNLGDLIFSALAYWCLGNEDTSDDPFVRDALNNFENNMLFADVFDKLVDLLLHDLIEDSILAKLEIRTYKLLSDSEIMNKTGAGINYLLSKLLKKDITYMNLINTIFYLEVLPYKDIYDTLDQLLISKYLTDSQLESLGIFVAYVLGDFTGDTNPVPSGDTDVIYSTEKVPVPVTRENYRLPTSVTVTMGEDSSTGAYITWLSKSTVDGDIEIYKADTEPEFTGKATVSADFDINLTSEKVVRSFPGIDLGIIGFLTYEFDMNKHTVSLTDLEPGATYYYRVGDAEKGWWSETGTVTTADGSKNVTFLHVTDPQSQNEKQYKRAWAKVLSEAGEIYDYDFILNTGDIVDHGDNSKHWAWALNTASEYLMDTFHMPASGNHEAYGTNATVNYFTLPYAPAQDTASGIYYSFDYNNVHIAVLNTNDLDENEAISESQLDWLKKDMASSKAQWKLVALHKAPYSQGSHYADDDICAIRGQLQALMPDLGVDMVFQGHDHVYMRTGSLDDNRLTAYNKTYLSYGGSIYRTQILPEGTTYAITGTAGVKTYIQNDTSETDKYFPRAEKILSVDAPMFAGVEIVDGILYFTAYTVDENGAEAVDRFAIQKDTTQGTVEENYTEPEEEKENSLINFFSSFKAIVSRIIRVMRNLIKLYASILRR